MSVTAMGWAWGCQCGSPSAKLILMSLADFADQDGECYPSVGLLAKLTEQSASTVRRRLQELETNGLIERREQYRDNGSRTVDLIRLLMEPPAAPNRSLRRPKGPNAAPSNLGGGALSDCEGAPATGEQTPLPSVVRPEPSSEPSCESSPPTPKGRRALQKRDPEFEQFRQRWGDCGTGASWPRAEAVWLRLTHEDRADAVRWLPRYLEDCENRHRKVCHPVTYLAERRWESFAPNPPVARVSVAQDVCSIAVDLARRGSDRTDWVFVLEGSTAWCAWHEAYRHTGVAFAGASPIFTERGAEGGLVRLKGRYFPSEFPPALAEAAAS